VRILAGRCRCLASLEGGFSKDAGVGILTCIDVYNLVYISQHFVSQKAS